MEPRKRGRPARTWVKLDCQGILHGSINWQLTLEEQAIWIKLFTLSAVCGGEPGMIQDNDGNPLPHGYIAQECHCAEELLESTLKKCIDEGRLSENSNGITITHFADYQFTEYDRQKPYRDKAKQRKRPPIKQCKCGYAIEDTKFTVNIIVCPSCGGKLKRMEEPEQ